MSSEQSPTATEFSHVKPGDSGIISGGLRDFFLYRDLGIAKATHGKVPIEWFEKNLISHVPMPHADYLRRVYPGFVQLSAFLSMNPERHKNAFKYMYQHLGTATLKRPTSSRCFTTNTWP